jgi:hypothetical protein
MSNPASTPEKAATPKHPVGRPSTYRPEICQQLIEAMAGGHSAEAGAAKIGISARSLCEWQQRHPEFMQAVHGPAAGCVYGVAACNVCDVTGVHIVSGL